MRKLGFLVLLPWVVLAETRSPFLQPAFAPNISFILDVSFVLRNAEPLQGHDHGHGEFNKERGFNLNYGELFLNAPVDPYFELSATIPFSEKGAEIEEAYVLTRGLPHGFQIKVGKFRSSFGRLNSQHPHLWDFAQQPLPYRAFLGEGLIEKGVQINWVAPTPFYLNLGIEVLQGENDRSFGVEGFRVGNVEVGDAPKPGLFVGFLKTSFDIGDLSLLSGISYAEGHSRLKEPEGKAFSGRTKLYGADLTAKYFFDSYRHIAFQGEYIHRDRRGTVYTYDGSTATESKVVERQGGFYTQLVWGFARRWRTGVQYNLLDKEEAYYGMLEFNPTEFSRIRVQIGKGEVVLQLTFAIGAHGAHPF